jgi:UDP-N-acetyl-D-glucosamine dehydrogenase
LIVTVCGQGYVGLSVAVAAAQVGHDVIGYDNNEYVILNLLEGKTKVPGVSSDQIKSLINSGKYKPTTNFHDTLGSQILILAVPTPLNDKRDPDLSYLIQLLELIAVTFKGKALVINESTSYPGTLRNIILPILSSSKTAEFKYASAPERVDPGNLNWDVQNTPRVVAGIDEESSELAANFYESFCFNVSKVSNPEVAEAAKIFENTFRQVNIALVNEFSEICQKLGISAYDAINAASTKPFGFMPFYPGIGVGGHCIPVDPSYLSYIARKNGIEANFIELANKINNAAPRKVALRIRDSFSGSLKGKRIQIAGISYKPGISDMREAPSIKLISELRVLGAQVFWFDPLVSTFENETSVPLDPTVDLGLIVTPHSIIDFSIWLTAKTKVFDLSASSEFLGWPKFL